MGHSGTNDFGLTVAVLRDHLPRGVSKKHLRYKKTQHSALTRPYKFFKPVVLEKEVQVNPDKNHKKLRVAMHSEFSCNFGSVSALDKVKLFVRKKEIGAGLNKRY